MGLQSQTRLSRLTFAQQHIYRVDMNVGKLREMGRTEEPGVLQSMESQRVGHDLVTEQQIYILAEIKFL